MKRLQGKNIFHFFTLSTFLQILTFLPPKLIILDNAAIVSLVTMASFEAGGL